MDVKAKKQKILGWGGAFTDATGINIHQLPQGAQENLLRSYFGEDGVDYSLCRVPIGGTDFSTRPYSYDDHLDGVGLPNFKLQEEDKDHKVSQGWMIIDIRTQVFVDSRNRSGEEVEGGEQFEAVCDCLDCSPVDEDQ